MSSLKAICFLFFFILSSGLKARDSVKTYKPGFLALPALSFGPEKGFEFGAVALYSFYTIKSGIDTRNSTFNFVGTYSTKSNVKLDHLLNLWSPNNLWHLRSQIRYANMPVKFYGIGSATSLDDEIILKQENMKIALDLERKLHNSIYAGLGLWFLWDRFTILDSFGMPVDEIEGIYAEGRVFMPSYSFVYDNRDKVNYTYTGSYAKVYVQTAFPILGGHYSFALITLDARNFWKISPTGVIAVQGYVQSIQGRDDPFYLIPRLGSDMIMRGYFEGRYRDQNYVASQIEFRYRPFAQRPDRGLFSLSRGAVVLFTGVGNVFKNGNFELNKFKLNYGIGAHYIFDPQDRLTVRADFGFGNLIPEKNMASAFYLSVYEAF